MGIIQGWPGRIWIDVVLNPGTAHNHYILEFFRTVTHLGSPLAFVVLTIASIIGLWVLRSYVQAIYLLIVVTSSWVINDLLKVYFSRPRPPGEALTMATGYSFPSGHAMVSIAFYGFLAYLAFYRGGKPGRTAAGGLALLIFLIGFSRVYLNVHYPSDVLAGWLFGLLILLISIYSMKHRKSS